jgi:hypothetical protein
MELLWTWAAAWTDASPNMSRLDPSGAVEVDADHPARKGKAVGWNRPRAQEIPGSAVLFSARSGRVLAVWA